MMTWTSDRIRETFLQFYADRNHQRAPSLALVPPGDDTLLFTNAGMVQFKDVFTGRTTLNYTRATSSQKCLRVSGKHNDLENVGRTSRHHTFFEMLGNFSFGDYFKREAIQSAWTLLTEVYKLPVDKLHVTVYPDDDEARQLWLEISGLPRERVHDDPENFWSMGETGACGPCSEIHYDQGSDLSAGREISFAENDDGDRYLEIWNLVFMQYDRSQEGTLTPLPAPSIDTGMGLERITSLLQGKQSNYDCDLFTPIIDCAAELAGVDYGQTDSESDIALRVIADHSRAAAFLIADGIYPSNEGRGYVLRRVMRRAMRFGRKIGLDQLFLVNTTAAVVKHMAGAYPDLQKKAEVIQQYVQREEESFGRTLANGLKRLEKAFGDCGEDPVIPGAVAFELYDTYGFPLDLTQQAAGEHGYTIEDAGFDEAMARQRAAGRASWKGAADMSAWEQLQEKVGSSRFSGYDRDEDRGHVLALLEGGSMEGEQMGLVTDVTPFYAESGGQAGDTGVITAPGGSFKVTGTHRPLEGLIVHYGALLEGTLAEGQEVTLRVNAVDRNLTRKNHSATHLMHFALRAVLGEHVRQAGSLVAPHRLRFDFSHFGPLSNDEIRRIEELVNQRIVDNVATQTDVLRKEEAIEKGAVAFFGDKYGDLVRVLTITEDSVELCGGTHVQATGDIGLFKIVSQGAVAAGVRRLEAVTGMDAVTWLHEREAMLQSVAQALEVGVAEVANKIARLQKDQSKLEKRVRQYEEKARTAGVASAEPKDIGGVKVLTLSVSGVQGGAMRDMADKARARLGSGIVMVISNNDPKVAILIAVTDDLKGQYPAGKLLGQIAPLVSGRGGGRPDMAQGGGSDPSGIEGAVTRF
ncbi:MAG: alanyl-tRNA synthetase, partial [Myxococcota bacterium]